MSFYLHKSKPNLIDLKLLKNYNNKIKNKYTIVDSSTKIENTSYEKINNIKNIIFDNIWNIIKEYYGFFIFLTLLIILLYIRYIEVNKRKAKIKKILFKD
jgi:hypothetical protein